VHGLRVPGIAALDQAAAQLVDVADRRNDATVIRLDESCAATCHCKPLASRNTASWDVYQRDIQSAVRSQQTRTDGVAVHTIGRHRCDVAPLSPLSPQKTYGGVTSGTVVREGGETEGVEEPAETAVLTLLGEELA
jgi:hypothetical protein